MANLDRSSTGCRFHTTADVSAFAAELEQNQPDLFSFESTEDKLQVVKGWLLDAGLIK
jgi:hypothetical protein